MAVKSVKNQYRGINAHLHSLYQAEGDWSEFHGAHIIGIFQTLRAQLLPMGYTASIEKSLQINRIDDAPRKPKADLLIHDSDPLRAQLPSGVGHTIASSASTIELTKLMTDNPLSDKDYHAIAIFRRIVEQPRKGTPVVWLELLSPTNKGGTPDAQTYKSKRKDLLNNGLVFVEIDYLNETPSTFDAIVEPQIQALNAHPYRIVVIDPRPEIAAGKADLYPFEVDELLPVVTIPLSGSDELLFDFGVPYAKTFEDSLFGAESVDYRLLPTNFLHYTPAQQTLILARMIAVIEAAQRGDSLESGVCLPTREISVQDGLIYLNQLTNKDK